MRFLCKGLKFGLLKTNYFRFCANVCRAVTMPLLRNRHHFKLMKSKFKGKEKFVAACLRPQEKLPIRKLYVFIVVAYRKGASCSKLMHVQSNVFLVRPIACQIFV